MFRGYLYGISSSKKILTVQDILQQVCHRAIRIANERKCYCPDFGISYGFRTAAHQFRLFKKGRKLIDGEWKITNKSKVVTYCDGYIKKSVHQTGYAIDFFAIGSNGKANFSNHLMALVATCFFEAASDLGVSIDWGGSFKSISDTGHIEVLKCSRKLY